MVQANAKTERCMMDANRPSQLLLAWGKQTLLFTAAVSVVLCTSRVPMFEDGCPDTLRAYCGFPLPFTACDDSRAWQEWQWPVVWLDGAVLYCASLVVWMVCRRSVKRRDRS